MDDHSTDDTARIAADAGARVLAVDDVLPELGPGEGKGEALYKSVAAARGDLIAWCDADIRDFAPHFVVGLVGPLLTRSDIAFVKGFYDRPVDGSPHGGGRVTELMARPVIAALFPHLASIVQPLSGEYAGRRSLLERLPFVQGYGVDLGLLIDIADGGGHRGDRPGRPRAAPPPEPLARRAGPAGAGGAPDRPRPGRRRAAARPPPSCGPISSPWRCAADERPALVDVSGYRRRTA